MTFIPQVDTDDRLIEDYGFVLAGITHGGCRFVALWGVLAFGSLAATEAFVSHKGTKTWFHDRAHLAVVQCRVDGTRINNVQIVHEFPVTS